MSLSAVFATESWIQRRKGQGTKVAWYQVIVGAWPPPDLQRRSQWSCLGIRRHTDSGLRGQGPVSSYPAAPWSVRCWMR